MKTLMKNLRKQMKRVANYYVEAMSVYGEALLKGGSYGCA